MTELWGIIIVAVSAIVSPKEEDMPLAGSSMFAAYVYAGQVTKQKIEDFVKSGGMNHMELLEIAKSITENELKKE